MTHPMPNTSSAGSSKALFFRIACLLFSVAFCLHFVYFCLCAFCLRVALFIWFLVRLDSVTMRQPKPPKFFSSPLVKSVGHNLNMLDIV